jgi:hypothetical protein
LPSPPSRPSGNVTVEPLGDLERAPAVLRLRVGGALGGSALADYQLFEGTLSSYHLGRIRGRELPATLVAREIEVVTWGEPPDVVVAPARALESGVVSLATPELGLVAEVNVDATLVPWLERRWPAPGERRGSGLELFCGTDVAAAAEGTVVLEPSGAVATVGRGVDDEGHFADSCVRLEPEARGAPEVPGLPPLLLGAVSLEPLPLVTQTNPDSHAPDCADGELVLGPACARVDDDRLTLVSYGAPSLWALDAPMRHLGAVASGESLVVRGFEPACAVRLSATVFDEAGLRMFVDAELETLPRHAHVVLNEVLANPAGSEASSEWVELANDGSDAVDLAGFVLSDAGSSASLPSFRIEPGEMALVVGAGFDPDPALDVLPAPGTRVIRLQELGASGLTNTGEALRLRDRDGRLLSLFPSIAARHAGVSIARRAFDASDTDATSFGEHTAPGASPGAKNTIAEP